MRTALYAAAQLIVATAALSAHGQTMIEGKNYDFSPAEYSVAAPPTLGPAKAKGLVIWNHGRGSTAASDKASPLALQFAQQGWDVYSLYRGWGSDDRTRALQIVSAGIEKAQAMGYKRIVLMGQSAGAYASIEAVRYGYEVDAVVATAPAAHGSYSGSTASSTWRANDFTMRTIWERYDGKKARIAVAYFNEDDFYEDQSPNIRAPWVAATLAKYGVPNLVIAQPAVANLKGHGAGQTWNFARRFGPCIYIFVETGSAPPCDESATAMATFQIALPDGFPRQDGDAFAGLWQTTWSHGRFTLLAFGAERDGSFRGLYRSGLGLASETPENIEVTVKRTGNGAAWRSGRYIFEIQPAANDTLAATRTDPSKPDDKATATLRRIN